MSLSACWLNDLINYDFDKLESIQRKRERGMALNNRKRNKELSYKCWQINYASSFMGISWSDFVVNSFQHLNLGIMSNLVAGKFWFSCSHR